MENANFKTLLKQIGGLLFDVDGVLTDNQVFLLESGELARSMSIRDGFAIKRAIEEGLRIGVISGGDYDPIRHRLAALGVEDVHLGVDNKSEAFSTFLQHHDLRPEQVLYMGDDLPDLGVMKTSGLAACPYDAVHEVRSLCGFVSNKNGGGGCVRDAIEQTMRAQGIWRAEEH